MCVLTPQLELAIADAKQFCEWDPNPTTRAEAEALLEAAEVCCHRLDDTVVPIAAHAHICSREVPQSNPRLWTLSGRACCSVPPVRQQAGVVLPPT